MTFGIKDIKKWGLSRPSAPQKASGGAPIVQRPTDGEILDQYGNPISSSALAQVSQRAPGFGEWWNFDSSNQQNPLAGHGSHMRLTNVLGTPLVINGQVTKAAASMLSIATPCVVTLDQQVAAGSKIVFTTTGALPTGLTPGQVYYVLAPTTSKTCNVSLTPGGAAIATSGTQSGNHTATYDPTPGVPAVQFNGSGVLQTDPANFLLLQRGILNLETLGSVTDDMIVIWFDLEHGTSLNGTYTLFFWGRSALEGWGMQLFGGAGLVKFKIRMDPGSGTGGQIVQLDGNFSLPGDAGTNTRSVVCVTISKGAANADGGNSGQGGGVFEICMHKQGVYDQGIHGQHNFQVWHVPRHPAGTIAPRFAADTGLTIGGRPGGGPTTIVGAETMGSAGFTGSNVLGLRQFGMMRRKRQAALGQTVVHQMLANIRAYPNVNIQPQCIAMPQLNYS